MTDEYILFFRVLRKIGRGKFVDFLISKSPWVAQITEKIKEKSVVGFNKSNVDPFNNLNIGEKIVIERGKI